MSNEVAIYNAPAGVSLVDIRMDAVRFPRIKSLPAQQATARLQQVVAMAYVYTGRPAEENKLQMVAAALLAELLEDKRHFGTDSITIEEVGHAVKTAILESPDDVFLNIAFFYKAVCNYCLGEGNEAQESAYRRKVALRQKALAESAAGALMTAAEGALLKNSKTPAK